MKELLSDCIENFLLNFKISKNDRKLKNLRAELKVLDQEYADQKATLAGQDEEIEQLIEEIHELRAWRAEEDARG